MPNQHYIREIAMNTKVDWVVYAKAIGIILVVYGHVARGLINTGFTLPESLYPMIDSVIYSFHMPLFFFLSGLFFQHSLTQRGRTGLVLNKVDTILYPYLIWSIIQGAPEALLSNYTNGNVALFEVFELWNPRAQFWFLYVLFIIFIGISAIYSIFSKKYGLLILALILWIGGKNIPDITILTLIINNLVFFYFWHPLLKTPIKSKIFVPKLAHSDINRFHFGSISISRLQPRIYWQSIRIFAFRYHLDVIS
jgi:fucose 4-O-acetylase-like acetyltransferase